MVYAMACANDKYMPSARFQLGTALKKGKVDKTLCFNIADMDEAFRRKNREILEAGEERRRGFYLWKPYFVDQALSHIKQGDFLIYLDSAGFYYRSSVKPITSYMDKNRIDMIGSRRFNYLEKHWTKRDAFVYMECDAPRYANQRQAMGGCFILKKTDRTVRIIQEWLRYAQDYRIISEAPNVCGMDNYDGFQEHRHDQSIMSLLQCKYGVKTIETIPIADFYVYHHTMETSIRSIRKELEKRRRQQIKDYIARKNMKGVYYVEQERIKNLFLIQKILRRSNR